MFLTKAMGNRRQGGSPFSIILWDTDEHGFNGFWLLEYEFLIELK